MKEKWAGNRSWRLLNFVEAKEKQLVHNTQVKLITTCKRKKRQSSNFIFPYKL